MPVVEDVVLSPCVRLCALDPATDTCVGCHRTIGEIKAWGGMTSAERRAVLAAIAERRTRAV